MQIQETIEYNMKSIRHVDNVVHSEPEKLRERARVSIKELQNGILEKGGYNAKI